jgi:hypothetical protein
MSIYNKTARITSSMTSVVASMVICLMTFSLKTLKTLKTLN